MNTQAPSFFSRLITTGRKLIVGVASASIVILTPVSVMATTTPSHVQYNLPPEAMGVMQAYQAMGAIMRGNPAPKGNMYAKQINSAYICSVAPNSRECKAYIASNYVRNWSNYEQVTAWQKANDARWAASFGWLGN